MHNLGNSIKTNIWTGRIVRNTRLYRKNSDHSLVSKHGQSDNTAGYSARPHSDSGLDNTDTINIDRSIDNNLVSLEASDFSESQTPSGNIEKPAQENITKIDVNDIAERVYKIMETELIRGKERSGK